MDTSQNGWVLPEPNWTFRRLVVIGSTLIVNSLLAYIVIAAPPAALMWIALALIIKNVWTESVYLIAPSSEYIATVGKAIEDARSKH